MGQAEILMQLTVRFGGFQRAQVCALNVFNQGPEQALLFCCLADNGRYRQEPGLYGGPPTAFSGDQIVRILFPALGQDDGLDYTVLLNGSRQLGEFYIINCDSWLPGVRFDLVYRDLGHTAGGFLTIAPGN